MKTTRICLHSDLFKVTASLLLYLSPGKHRLHNQAVHTGMPTLESFSNANMCSYTSSNGCHSTAAAQHGFGDIYMRQMIRNTTRI
ncbi:hypothetical protein BsWGS_08301 [Bradybaena similaris]